MTDVGVPERTIRATVTVAVQFTGREISDERWFRLIVELYASDAEEGSIDLPSYPLHTFLFAPALPSPLAILLATPYRLVRATSDPPPITVEDTVTLASLDEDPEILTNIRQDRDALGIERTVVEATTTRDEIYAKALLVPVPVIEGRSRDRAVPGSGRRLPDQVIYDPRLRFRF